MDGYSDTIAVAAPTASADAADAGSTQGMGPDDVADTADAPPVLPTPASDGEALAADPADAEVNPWQRASFRQPSWQQASWQPPDTKSDAVNGRAYVQCGAFSNRGNAERAHRQLTRLGPVKVVPHRVASQAIYRVRVGPLNSLDEAGRIQSVAVQAGFPGSHIVIE